MQKRAVYTWVTAGLVVGAFVACRKNSEEQAVRAVPVATVVLPSASTGIAPTDAGDVKATAALVPSQIEFQQNGALVVTTPRSVCAVDSNGKGRCIPVPPKSSVTAASREGLVVETRNDATLYATPSLDELFRGDLRDDGFVFRKADTTIAMQMSGKLVALKLPKSHDGQAPNAIERTASGTYAILFFYGENDSLVYEVATATLIGKLPPLLNVSGASQVRIVGDRLFAIERGQMSIRELPTLRIVRKRAIPCGNKEVGLGNIVVSPSETHVLVTCGWDGILLDGKTLNPLKRFSKIIPGCDNGVDLPASFDKVNEKELVVEGCGGEARLNLSTGTYRCSDNPGIVGAPYAMMPDDVPSKAPAGRENLPSCTSEKEREARASVLYLDDARTHWLERESEEADVDVLHGPGVRISLDACTPNTVALAKDASRFACVEGDSVVVRALPKGDEVARFKPE